MDRVAIKVEKIKSQAIAKITARSKSRKRPEKLEQKQMYFAKKLAEAEKKVKS